MGSKIGIVFYWFSFCGQCFVHFFEKYLLKYSYLYWKQWYITCLENKVVVSKIWRKNLHLEILIPWYFEFKRHKVVEFSYWFSHKCDFEFCSGMITFFTHLISALCLPFPSINGLSVFDGFIMNCYIPCSKLEYKPK